MAHGKTRRKEKSRCIKRCHHSKHSVNLWIQSTCVNVQYQCLHCVLRLSFCSCAVSMKRAGTLSDPSSNLRAIMTRFIQFGPGVPVGQVAAASVTTASRTVTQTPTKQWNHAPAAAAASSTVQRLNFGGSTPLGQGMKRQCFLHAVARWSWRAHGVICSCWLHGS